MPVNDQTPAPSRRFLPPSSSSSSKPLASSSGGKPPFVFSQANFTPSSASPFAHSSRFTTPAKIEKEDIDTSFEDANSSPSRATRGFVGPSTSSGNDAIYDEDEVPEHSSTVGERPLLSLQQTSFHVGHDLDIPGEDATDSVYTEQRESFDPVTPLPKRRKISALTQKPMTVIDISSSPEPESEAPSKIGDDPDLGNDHDNLSPLLVTPPMPTRFKTPMATANMVNRHPPKPLFKPFARDSRLNAEAESTLPDAFSPSRRKGRRGYLSGGLADTVRNWVLNAATEESQQGRREEIVIEVTSASMDRSGRAIEISDADGKNWLLVMELSRGDIASPATTLTRVRGRGKVLVRGTHTVWKLSGRQQSCESEVFVAVQWDVG